MPNPIDRNHFIERGAEVSAAILHNIHENQPDTSMVDVDGHMKIKPYLPIISQFGTGTDARRVTSISDNEGGWIELSAAEDERLQQRIDFHLAETVRNKIRARGPDTPESIFTAAQALMQRAEQIDSVLLVGMNTAKQQAATKSRNFVIVAPYKGSGPTLIHPEPSTTGQKYGG